MLGIQYYRVTNGYRISDIADFLDICEPQASRMECDALLSRPAKYYEALCGLYGIRIEELISEKPDVPKKNVTKATTQAQTPGARFMRANYFTVRTLADELGVSRQMVSNLCKLKELPAKYIKKLVEIEGITFEDFEEKYGKGA